jgi:hypothetical protein
MEDQILAKIRTELERGIKSESQAVYLLVEIRKLLDRDRQGTQPYNSLRLYADWVVHVCLEGKQAQEIVKKADAFFLKLTKGTHSDKERIEFARISEFETFRDEINQFLHAKHIPPFSDSGWSSFLRAFLNVIEDCPLICRTRNSGLKGVDEVVLIRKGGGMADGAYGPIIWALCFDGKLRMSFGGNVDLSDETVEQIIAFSNSRDQ